MLLIRLRWSLLEGNQGGLKAGVISAGHGYARERLDETGKKRGNLGSPLFFERFQGAAIQIFRNLIWPQSFNDGGEFPQSGGDRSAPGVIRTVDATSVMEQDMSRLAARSIGACFGELRQSGANRHDGDAPDSASAKHCRVFASWQLQPEFFEELFLMGVGGPGARQRGEMLRRVDTGIGTSRDQDGSQVHEKRFYGFSRECAAGKFRGQKFGN